MAEASKRKMTWLVPALLLLIGGGCWMMYRSLFPPFTPPPLPVPNGYDQLAEAASLLSADTHKFDELDQQQLAALVEQNTAALSMARVALQEDCVVPIDWMADRLWLEKVHMPRSGSLRSLGRAFAAEARLAKLNKQSEDAIGAGFDSLELARATGNQGLLIDRMMAGVMHYYALNIFRDQVSHLSRDQCLQLIERLQAKPIRYEPIENVLERETALFSRINGTWQTLSTAGVARSQRQQTIAETETTDKQHEVLDTILQTHLAIRAYQLDQGEFPSSLAELVPEYLATAPQDVFSNNPLVYRLQPGWYILYSVGPDGADDGGVPTTDGQTGDWLLEASE